MKVNQAGNPVFETPILFEDCFQDAREVAEAVLALADHLGLSFVRTNATKHGETRILIRSES